MAHFGRSIAHLRRWVTGWVPDRVDVVLLAVIAFALPFVYWPGATEYNYTRCVFAIVSISLVTVLRAIVSVRRAARREHETLALPWAVWPLAALIAASLASLTRATDVRSGMASLAVLLAFAQFGLLVANAARTQRDATLLLAASFASACVVAGHATLQYAGILSGTGVSGSNNMIATQGNQDAVAGLAACALFPGLILLGRTKSWWTAAVVTLGVGLLFSATLLTQQMGALLGLVVALAGIGAGWVFFRPKHRDRRHVAATAGVMALAAVILVALLVRVVPDAISRGSVASSVWEANSGEARTMFWSTGIAMWQRNLLTGVGLANYKTVYPAYEAAALAAAGESTPSQHIANAAQAHNDYLQAAAELGTPGLLAVTGLLGIVAVSIWRRLRAEASASRPDLLILSGGVAVFLVHAFVGFPLHFVATALAAVVYLAIVLSPAHGAAALHRVHVRRAGAVAYLITIAVLGGTMSVLAVRDLAANVLQLRGTRLLHVGSAEAAVVALEQSTALDVNPRVSLFYLASAQYQVGRYADALDTLTRCLRVFPDENAYILYGDLAAGLGQLDRGMEALDFILTTNPSPGVLTRALYVRALILREKGDVSAAAAALRDLTTRSPDYEPAHRTLGDLLAAAGQIDEARALFERALALVDGELPGVRQAASSKLPMTYEAYARAHGRLAELTQEREEILRRLAALGSAPP